MARARDAQTLANAIRHQVFERAPLRNRTQLGFARGFVRDFKGGFYAASSQLAVNQDHSSQDVLMQPTAAGIKTTSQAVGVAAARSAP